MFKVLHNCSTIITSGYGFLEYAPSNTSIFKQKTKIISFYSQEPDFFADFKHSTCSFVYFVRDFFGWTFSTSLNDSLSMVFFVRKFSTTAWSFLSLIWNNWEFWLFVVSSKYGNLQRKSLVNERSVPIDTSCLIRYVCSYASFVPFGWAVSVLLWTWTRIWLYLTESSETWVYARWAIWS